MMTPAEIEALRATMPWQERIIPTGKGGLVQMIDRNGNEVPLLEMTRFLMVITQRMAPPVPAGAPA